MQNPQGSDLNDIALFSSMLDNSTPSREESRFIMSFNPIPLALVFRRYMPNIQNLHHTFHYQHSQQRGGGVIPIQQTMNNFKPSSFINPNSGPSSLIPCHPLLCVIPQRNITNLKNPHRQPHSPILSQSFQNPWQKRRPNNLILHRLWILKHHRHPILLPSQKLVILIMRT